MEVKKEAMPDPMEYCLNCEIHWNPRRHGPTCPLCGAAAFVVPVITKPSQRPVCTCGEELVCPKCEIELHHSDPEILIMKKSFKES